LVATCSWLNQYTLVALDACTLSWTRDDIVFNGASPRLYRASLWPRKKLIYVFWLGQKYIVFWSLPAVLADSWDQCNGDGRLFALQVAYVI
jgi:hypothetical protein